MFAHPPCLGQRRSAIILHAEFAGEALSSSFQSHGRSCSLDVLWGSWKLRLVCSHLSAGPSLVEYRSSLEDLEFLCDSRPPGYYLHVGVDAQSVVGPPSWDDAHIIGEFAEKERGP